MTDLHERVVRLRKAGCTWAMVAWAVERSVPTVVKAWREATNGRRGLA